MHPLKLFIAILVIALVPLTNGLLHTITKSTAGIDANVNQITIFGSGLSLCDDVQITRGAVGSCSGGGSGGQITININTKPTSAGDVSMRIKCALAWSEWQQVGVFLPVVTPNTAAIQANTISFDINGFAFSVGSPFSVQLSKGGVCSVANRTTTKFSCSLDQKFTDSGDVTALVTANDVQAATAKSVATVIPTIAFSATTLQGDTSNFQISGAGWSAANLPTIQLNNDYGACTPFAAPPSGGNGPINVFCQFSDQPRRVGILQAKATRSGQTGQFQSVAVIYPALLYSGDIVIPATSTSFTFYGNALKPCIAAGCTSTRTSYFNSPHTELQCSQFSTVNDLPKNQTQTCTLNSLPKFPGPLYMAIQVSSYTSFLQIVGTIYPVLANDPSKLINAQQSIGLSFTGNAFGGSSANLYFESNAGGQCTFIPALGGFTYAACGWTRQPTKCGALLGRIYVNGYQTNQAHLGYVEPVILPSSTIAKDSTVLRFTGHGFGEDPSRLTVHLQQGVTQFTCGTPFNLSPESFDCAVSGLVANVKLYAAITCSTPGYNNVNSAPILYANVVDGVVVDESTAIIPQTSRYFFIRGAAFTINSSQQPLVTLYGPASTGTQCIIESSYTSDNLIKCILDTDNGFNQVGELSVRVNNTALNPPGSNITQVGTVVVVPDPVIHFRTTPIVASATFLYFTGSDFVGVDIPTVVVRDASGATISSSIRAGNSTYGLLDLGTPSSGLVDFLLITLTRDGYTASGVTNFKVVNVVPEPVISESTTKIPSTIEYITIEGQNFGTEPSWYQRVNLLGSTGATVVCDVVNVTDNILVCSPRATLPLGELKAQTIFLDTFGKHQVIATVVPVPTIYEITKERARNFTSIDIFANNLPEDASTLTVKLANENNTNVFWCVDFYVDTSQGLLRCNTTEKGNWLPDEGVLFATIYLFSAPSATTPVATIVPQPHLPIANSYWGTPRTGKFQICVTGEHLGVYPAENILRLFMDIPKSGDYTLLRVFQGDYPVIVGDNTFNCISQVSFGTLGVVYAQVFANGGWSNMIEIGAVFPKPAITEVTFAARNAHEITIKGVSFDENPANPPTIEIWLYEAWDGIYEIDTVTLPDGTIDGKSIVCTVVDWKTNEITCSPDIKPSANCTRSGITKPCDVHWFGRVKTHGLSTNLATIATVVPNPILEPPKELANLVETSSEIILYGQYFNPNTEQNIIQLFPTDDTSGNKIECIVDKVKSTPTILYCKPAYNLPADVELSATVTSFGAITASIHIGHVEPAATLYDTTNIFTFAASATRFVIHGIDFICNSTIEITLSNQQICKVAECSSTVIECERESAVDIENTILSAAVKMYGGYNHPNSAPNGNGGIKGRAIMEDPLPFVPIATIVPTPTLQRNDDFEIVYGTLGLPQLVITGAGFNPNTPAASNSVDFKREGTTMKCNIVGASSTATQLTCQLSGIEKEDIGVIEASVTSFNGSSQFQIVGRIVPANAEIIQDLLGVSIGAPLGITVLIAIIITTFILVRKHRQKRLQAMFTRKASKVRNANDGPKDGSKYSGVMTGENGDVEMDEQKGRVLAAALTNWGIPFNDIVFGDVVGKGSFGKVYKGTLNGKPVAIKEAMLEDDKAREDFFSEAILMLGMPPHKNVVQVLGLSQVPEKNMNYVIMELLYGSLDKIVFDSENREQLTEKEMLRYARGVCAGMAHVAQEGIVHRDLASRNILIAKDGTPKVSDFGMSRALRERESGKTNANTGPIQWMSPENFYQEYSEKSDVWSFGCIIYEICTGHEPHEGIDKLEVALNTRDKGIHPEIPKDAPQILQSVMEECWKYKAEDRPTFAALCEMLKDGGSKNMTNRTNKTNKNKKPVKSESTSDSASGEEKGSKKKKKQKGKEKVKDVVEETKPATQAPTYGGFPVGLPADLPPPPGTVEAPPPPPEDESSEVEAEESSNADDGDSDNAPPPPPED